MIDMGHINATTMMYPLLSHLSGTYRSCICRVDNFPYGEWSLLTEYLYAWCRTVAGLDCFFPTRQAVMVVAVTCEEFSSNLVHHSIVSSENLCLIKDLQESKKDWKKGFLLGLEFWRNGVVSISAACAPMAVLASALAVLEDKTILFTVWTDIIEHVQCFMSSLWRNDSVKKGIHEGKEG